MEERILQEVLGRTIRLLPFDYDTDHTENNASNNSLGLATMGVIQTHNMLIP
jgi:hypothetical protein